MTSWPGLDLLPLHGQRLFVTGGTGFVGRSLLDYFGLSAQRHGSDFEVHLLSRDPQGFLARFPRYANASWLKMLAGRLDRLPVRSDHYTGVIHAASDTHASMRCTEWIDQIVGGTQQVLDFAVGHRASRFLLLSSGAVYGNQPHDCPQLHEDYPGAPPTTAPTSVYGQAKRLAEQLAFAHWHEQGLAAVSARLFALVSEHVPLNGPYAIGNFIGEALAGRTLVLTGNPSTQRSYIDGLEVAHWLLTLLFQGEPGQAYNVGSDRAISIGELAELVVSTLASGVQIAQLPASHTPPGSRYIPDIGRARALGLDIHIPLESAITRAAAGIRKHMGLDSSTADRVSSTGSIKQ